MILSQCNKSTQSLMYSIKISYWSFKSQNFNRINSNNFEKNENEEKAPIEKVY